MGLSISPHKNAGASVRLKYTLRDSFATKEMLLIKDKYRYKNIEILLKPWLYWKRQES